MLTQSDYLINALAWSVYGLGIGLMLRKVVSWSVKRGGGSS